jgi:hypothetical protein
MSLTVSHFNPNFEEWEDTELATREDVLAAVRELGGVEVETWQRGDGYWAISPPEDSPGRYLIVSLDTGDPE